MIAKNNIIIVLILFLSVFLVAIYLKKTKDKCLGCGGCEYEKYTDTVKIDKFYKRDSIDYINLKSTLNSNHEYKGNKMRYIFRIGKEFYEKEIKDTSNKYSIIVERINQGTCAPYIIKEIKLIKK
jgi:ferredoxin